MVLCVVVLVLISRVYDVVRPATEEQAPSFSPPVNRPLTAEERVQMGFPVLSLAPPPLVPVVWKPLWERNPFWFNSASGGAVGGSGAAADTAIRLLRINPLPGGGSTAQIEVASLKQWCREGEQFVKYTLVSIDPAAGECVVYSEELGKRITLKKPQKAP